MKNNIRHLFVDDGYPEAEEYETNYISYNMGDPGSYNRAAETANSMMSASRISDKMAFRTIPLDSYDKHRLPRSYRRRRFPMGISRIRHTLVRLVKN